jgi:hypothetical protein
MKLKLINTESTPVQAKRLSGEFQREMDHLYSRLSTNSHGDSDSVRLTILGRMIYLLYQKLHK